MKASELIDALQKQITERGDLQVEFFCDHKIAPWFAARPVEEVGWSVGTVNGQPHRSLLLCHSQEWGKIRSNIQQAKETAARAKAFFTR